MCRRAYTFLIAIATLLACLGVTRNAEAIQLLVRPGDDWSGLAQKARPGDEIILMPGTHKSASLDGLAGTATSPIVIRSIDRDHVALIEGDREGLRLRRPQHVVIRDLTISGASVTGLSITDEPFSRPGV